MPSGSSSDSRSPSDVGLAARRAFFFDLDGTLIDSSDAHRRAFETMLREYAPEALARFDYAAIKGRGTRESVATLGDFDAARAHAMAARKQDVYRAALAAGEVQLCDGARELLAHLDARGRKLVLVTSASRAAASAVLDRFGLSARFAGLVCGDEVSRGKPDPAIYTRALALHAVPAEAVLTVEDSAHGAAASTAAGIDVVLVHVAPADGVRRYARLADFYARVREALP